MIVLTWNLGRRNHADQIDLIRAAQVDIVALQEVSTQRYATLARELAGMGLVHQLGGLATARAYPFANVIASRWTTRDTVAGGPDVPFPERVQVAIVATPFGDVEILNVHVPAATSSGVAVKVATFEGIARYLARPSALPRIMCGDFNTPKAEAAGHISYWGNAHQQRAERAVIEGDATTGLHDAFRRVNGVDAAAASWRASKTVTRRYDHVFASPGLEPVAAQYGDLEEIREQGMSDHAPLRVVLQLVGEAAEHTATVLKAPPAHVVTHDTPPPVPMPAAKRLESNVASLGGSDSDLIAFLERLLDVVDVRERPNGDHRREFRTYWIKAAAGGTMADRTLRRLTWANLGFRVGEALGEASDAKITTTFERFATIYMGEHD